jgi:hypothetical protein
MLLFGPASEWLTYILLAPVVALALVECHQRPIGSITRTLVAIAYVLLLLAAMRNAFVPRWNEAALLAMQPFAAAFFMIYAVMRYGRNWPAPHSSLDDEREMKSGT